MSTGSTNIDLSQLVQPASSKIVMVILDGLGGFARPNWGSELEEARTPNFDVLAEQGCSGLHEPVGPGITPGSGPAHLALFGYDPVEFQLGRGLLSATGLGVDMRPGDVAIRGNLATLNAAGIVTDRRAGRLPDAEAAEVIDLLASKVSIPGVEVQFVHEAQHRVLVVLKGHDLSPHVADTDPQVVGVPPSPPMAHTRYAERTAGVITELNRQVGELLAGQPRANTVLLRGFDTHRELPSMHERYGVSAAAIAVYPMYQGLGRLVGMEVLPGSKNLGDELDRLRTNWADFDFFFFHHKPADSAGEDGSFDAKVAAIEAMDAVISDIVALQPDVLLITGDHATPSQLAGHSWHPVPVLLWGPRVGRDEVVRFGERWSARGSLGRRPAKDLMPIVLACAGRLAKYGA
ncbi:MAG: 2,3-bisphosphoglycerate-independent phosphoglycerate mutase [Acidimicrobiales bacterium]